MVPKIKFEYKITAAYLVLGGIWIIFSDKILYYFVQDTDLLTQLQTFKGWFYVTITGILFYFLLKKHLEKLRKAEREAKESDRLKTAFLQNISHEIRTPMNGIVGFSGLLESENLNEDTKKEYIRIITQSSNQLLSIVNDVLDISMIQSGTIKANNDIVNLNGLLDELFHSFNPLVKKEVTLSVHKTLDDSSAFILTDVVKLRQVLYNLLSNANKFTEKGRIVFGYRLEGDELVFYVEDTGIGIARDLQDKIFERFQKDDTNRLKFYDGIGLGLAISKGYTDILGGKIRVNSEVDKGSVFYVTIPYKQVNPKNGDFGAEDNHSKKVKKTTILLVEDEESNIAFVKEILNRERIQFIVARNGKDAVNICRNDKNIQLVIMDLKMPKMDGYEATKQIKEFRADLPVVAQTAFALEEEKQKILNSGFDDYISKPYKKEQLLKIIRNVTEKN